MDFGTLLIILVFVAPIIEKILTAGKKPPEGPPQKTPLPRPQQRPQAPPRRPAPYEVPQGSAPPTAQPGNASDMLPDDLWEMVTGEKRKPRSLPDVELPRLPNRNTPRTARIPHTPRHLPESTHSYDDEATDEEALATREQQPSRELSIPPRVPAGKYVPVHAPPQVISLEDNIPTDEARHTQFHERLPTLPPAARMRVDVVPLAAMLASNAALRQAFVMHEVLGKPKGLE